MEAPDPFLPLAAFAKLKLGRIVDALRSRPPNVPVPDPPAGEAVALVVLALLVLALLFPAAADAFDISRRHPPRSPSSPPPPAGLGLILTLGARPCRPAGGTPLGLVRILGVLGAGEPGPLWPIPPSPNAVPFDGDRGVGDPAREP